MGEWLKPPDCKSGVPQGAAQVQILLHTISHHFLAAAAGFTDMFTRRRRRGAYGKGRPWAALGASIGAYVGCSSSAGIVCLSEGHSIAAAYALRR